MTDSTFFETLKQELSEFQNNLQSQREKILLLETQDLENIRILQILSNDLIQLDNRLNSIIEYLKNILTCIGEDE